MKILFSAAAVELPLIGRETPKTLPMGAAAEER